MLFGDPVFPLVKFFAFVVLALMPGLAMAGPPHQSEIKTTINLSQGYRHGDTVFFLADIHRYRPGRTFWFILPLKAWPKTILHQTRLYSLDAKTGTLNLETVLRDPAELTCMVGNAKWVLKDGSLFVSYNPSNRISPLTGRTERLVFQRDMVSGEVRSVNNPEKAEKEIFSDYRSPYSSNPNMVEMSEYKKLLPDGWVSEMEAISN